MDVPPLAQRPRFDLRLVNGWRTADAARMITVRGHFDGKALQLDEPADLPLNGAFEIHLKPLPAVSGPRKSLARLADLLAELPENPAWPADGASQHDHYLHGATKRP